MIVQTAESYYTLRLGRLKYLASFVAKQHTDIVSLCLRVDGIRLGWGISGLLAPSKCLVRPQWVQPSGMGPHRKPERLATVRHQQICRSVYVACQHNVNN
jgi:hypothetical protein